MPHRRVRHSADPSVDETLANGEHRGLRPVGHPELREHPADVGLDRLLADSKPLRDLLVGEPLDHQPEHVAFARR